jgi:CRISPR-associated endoribonuclease Cas6
MKFRITLQATDKHRRLLPLNYQYPLSAWIYKTISEGNHAFAEFLHERGFELGKKKFKLFTFSWLMIPAGSFRIEGDRLRLLDDTMHLDVSFLAPEAMQHFVAGLFQQQNFLLGDRVSQVPLQVVSMEALPLPTFRTVMRYRTNSPILVSRFVEGSKTASYLHPDEPMYSNLFIDNLIHKFASALQAGMLASVVDFGKDLPGYELKILSEPKSKMMLIKANTPQQTHIKAYHYDFELHAPESLQRIGYITGFGEKNSLGLGSVEYPQ